MKTIAQIAAELQGYDPQALPAKAVLDFLQRLVTPVTESTEQPLFDALGKVLSADVISPMDVPPHDNSAMDGYAFDGSQLQGDVPLTLKVVGTALAGKAWVGTAGLGDCVKIMTGAIMPAGLDTVVPQEIVTQLGGETAFVVIPPGMLKLGDNRRFRGEDLAQGHPALLKGQTITPARLGLAASLGLPSLPCWRPLRWLIFQPATRSCRWASRRVKVPSMTATATPPLACSSGSAVR